jgi:murein DD-endopeptidase MepM/ murein hydrolase activator NlpD
LARYRYEGGDDNEFYELDEPVFTRMPARVKGAHRVPVPPLALRGKIVAAAVAVGALAAATAGESLAPAGNAADSSAPIADPEIAAASFAAGGTSHTSLQVVPVARVNDTLTEAQKVADSRRTLAAQSAAAREAARPRFIRPAAGLFTSGFGGRWGDFHYGIDIANARNTPILAAADGVIIEAGPASGFGIWVRQQLSDGTVLVYGHMTSFSVKEGQKVKAGQQIAKMGNRGFSTGYHLHFEVWDASGKKINPVPWLNARGVTL